MINKPELQALIQLTWEYFNLDLVELPVLRITNTKKGYANAKSNKISVPTWAEKTDQRDRKSVV